MCGLFGVVTSTTSKNEEQIFKELMVVSSLRGTHSTGVGVISKPYTNDKNYYVDVAKAVGNPFNLMETKQFDNVMGMNGKYVLLGHCRYATRGGHTKANAHPFITDNVVGTHNGTINFGLVDEKKYGTDSECLLNMIDTIGVHDAIPKVEGAWALTWFDFRNDSFNVLRNKERTLFYTMNKAKTTMFYASEFEMLDLVLGRSPIIVDDNVYTFETDKMYSFDMRAGANWYDTMEVKEVKGKEVPKIVYPIVKDAPFRDEVQKYYPPYKRPVEAQTTPHKVVGIGTGSETSPLKSTTNVTTLPSGGHTSAPSTAPTTDGKKRVIRYQLRRKNGAKYGYRNEYLSDHKYNQLLDKGCAWCSSQVEEGEHFLWIDRDNWTCEDCTESPEVRNNLKDFSEEIATINDIVH